MEDRLNEVYRQRGLLAVKTAHLAQRLGYKVYRRRLSEVEWEVLYIELPEGQLSYHFSDEDAHMIKQFPVNNEAQWDGKFNGRDEEFMLIDQDIKEGTIRWTDKNGKYRYANPGSTIYSTGVMLATHAWFEGGWIELMEPGIVE